MRTKILILFLVSISIASIAQQNVDTEEFYHGNTHYIIERNQCRLSINLGNSEDFQDYSLQKRRSTSIIDNQEFKRDVSNSELVHLTVLFNNPMTSNTDVIITNSVTALGKYEMNWSDDKLTADIDLEPGIYEIFAMCNYWQSTGDVAFVLLGNFNLNIDTTAYIDFTTMANHILNIVHYDEKGQEINPSDTSIIKNQRMVNVEFPEDCYFHSCSVYSDTPITGNLRFSDFTENYKIIVNNMCVKDKKLYISDIGSLDGINADTLLQNSPSSFKMVNLGCQFSPSAGEFNYLTFDYGAIFKYSTTYMLFLHEENTDNYPFHSSDTLNAFISNMEMPENRSVFSFITDVNFWEKVPDDEYPAMKITSDPFRVTTDDSIAFTKWNLTNLTPIFSDNSYLLLGATSPLLSVYFENNIICEDCISGYTLSTGQTGEQRNSDLLTSTYAITKDGELLSGGLLTDFFEPYIISEPGIYGLSVVDKNYRIRDILGESRLDAIFDMTINDANPPVLSFLKLRNSAGNIVNSFNSNDHCELIFSAFDKDIQSNTLSNPASVDVFYKRMESNDWVRYDDIILNEMFDSVNYGSIYRCDISEVFALFDIPGYLDLKILVTDQNGNSISQTFDPVAYIADNVNTPIIGSRDDLSIEVWPNPIKDMYNISFELEKESKLKFSVYDQSGKLAQSILNKNFSNGKHQIALNSEKLKAGLYFLRVETDDTFAYKVIIKN